MLTAGYFLIGLIVAAMWLKTRDISRWNNFVDWGLTVCLWPVFLVKLFKP